MATNKSVYVCNSCGYETAKWFGQCPSCGEWNTMEEQARPALSKSGQKREAGASYASAFRAERLSEINASDEQRSSSGINEFDRVLGGGLVKGSVVLLCGDPGIGKSTILLQVSQHYGREFEVLYISGEESAHQIKLRAERLNVTTENLRVLCETDVGSICEYIKSERPGLVIIDSIQTMTIAEINSYAGSVSQVRESTNALTRTAKDCGVSVIIVGHVNKDGNIAGPKVLEHIVDTVLYFEGERNLSYRILRAVKNRFGSTNEIGVFDMSG